VHLERSAVPLHAFILALSTSGSAQIKDNSFLLEEAYNQEPGVVQHINSFVRSGEGEWSYLFTQEWPLGSLQHQLSYSLLLQHSRGEGTGFGDAVLNYRYQLIGTAQARTAMAPRVSLTLPLGNERRGRGSGGLGFQVNLPLSLVLSPRLTTHWNAGATLVPSAGNESGRATTLSPNLGASVVWSFSPKFDALVEAVWINQESVVGEGRTSREGIALLSPGFRVAWEVANGVELVPGAAYTLDLSGPPGNDAIFLYLSLEHPFHHQ
jgi:hypothetical protein